VWGGDVAIDGGQGSWGMGCRLWGGQGGAPLKEDTVSSEGMGNAVGVERTVIWKKLWLLPNPLGMGMGRVSVGSDRSVELEPEAVRLTRFTLNGPAPSMLMTDARLCPAKKELIALTNSDSPSPFGKTEGMAMDAAPPLVEDDGFELSITETIRISVLVISLEDDDEAASRHSLDGVTGEGRYSEDAVTKAVLVIMRVDVSVIVLVGSGSDPVGKGMPSCMDRWL
jgi:hypothetical protein